MRSFLEPPASAYLVCVHVRAHPENQVRARRQSFPAKFQIFKRYMGTTVLAATAQKDNAELPLLSEILCTWQLQTTRCCGTLRRTEFPELQCPLLPRPP